ncbi:hypothetical protein [Chlamydia pecorum]|uniref:Uncharacterized protein n=1 Tax=Chlamydia pecorum TaxID=85991 RepID=A0AA40PQN9_9CHLA|nr:hypothetical protein [Chlamydia pecorum]AGW38206.1 hypothetical protein CPE1_0728 [Chlamydia pecorum PV3056/3]KTF28834.1 hypothetical protein cpL1_0045 [Chlamydia pecorum]KZN27240.1 hypothetical protein cpL17_0171 [Chlamydia pecorum]KZN27901.1 hypothetical protein cpL71_0160 [Chlamydia pecorum]
MRVIFPDKHNQPSSFCRLLKRLPLCIFISSCVSPVFSYILHKIFRTQGVLEIFALSSQGVQKGYLWQFLTYPFFTADSLCIHKEQCFEITQRFLIRNTLDFLFFYKATDFIIRKLGVWSFLTLVSIQIPSIGFLIWCCMKLFGTPQAFFGPESLICSTMLVWIFLDPEKRLGLGPIPLTISRKWGFLILLGFYFCILIFSGSPLIFLGSILSLGLAWFFCKKEKIPNPYTASLRF